MINALLLAQQSASQAPTETETLAALAALLVIVLVAVAVTLAVNIIVCVLLYLAFDRIPAEHRTMNPLLVWLLLIPLFNVLWNFWVFLRLPESYQSYFAARGDATVGDCGRKIGLWYSICVAASLVPCVNYVAGPAALVLLIIFLIKVFDLRGKLAT